MDESERLDFSSTRWTLIDRVRSLSPEERRAALEQLLKIYLPALRAHLVVRRRMNRQDAADLLQDFVASKILEKDLVGRADRSRGRFRGFLLTALNRFYIDRLRQQMRFKPSSIEAAEYDPAQRAECDVFDVAWCRAVVAEALRRMREESKGDATRQIWDVFQYRILHPLTTGAPALDYDEIVKRCAFDTPRQASNALITARRRFFRHLRSVIAQYAGEEIEITAEIEELRHVLVASGGMDHDVLPEEDTLELDGESSIQSLGGLAPRSLGTLFALETNPPALWSEHEKSQLLTHFLRTPLNVVWISFPVDREEENDWCTRPVRELLCRPDSPIILLQALKRTGRTWARESTDRAMRDVGAIIYFASIAAGLVHHDRHISKSDDAILENGFRRALAIRWNVPAVRDLLRKACRRIS